MNVLCFVCLLLTVMLAIERLSSWLKVPLLVVSVALLEFFKLLSVADIGSRVGKRRRADKANIPRTVSKKKANPSGTLMSILFRATIKTLKKNTFRTKKLVSSPGSHSGYIYRYINLCLLGSNFNPKCLQVKDLLKTKTQKVLYFKQIWTK